MGDVIQFAASHLRLKQAVDVSGQGVIKEWLKKHPQARAKFRVRVKHMARFPRTEWTKKQFRHLQDGLYEIKWEAGNVPYRALGFDSGGYFVMVLGCTHKQSVYDPSNCITTALTRMREAKNGKRGIIGFEVG